MSINGFDLDAVCAIIAQHKFRRIALQFPDEFLDKCISIYTYVINRINDNDVDVYIIGDSTYGSSVDDISAQHVDSDILVYFGSDLSSSGSMPVMVVPYRKEIDVENCLQKVSDELNKDTVGESTQILLVYELDYSHAIENLKNQLNLNITLAELPSCANLLDWKTEDSQMSSLLLSNLEYTKVGGLLVLAELINNPDLIILYVGNKPEQLVSINIRMSEHMIISYNPDLKECNSQKGCESKVFRERYGGLLRVGDANIIGMMIYILRIVSLMILSS
jgi:diphthamide biosynthesis protein 2